MFYYGVLETMSSSKELDIIANLYHETKDKKYKDLWYKKVKEYVNGLNTIERRSLSSSRSNQRDDEGD